MNREGWKGRRPRRFDLSRLVHVLAAVLCVETHTVLVISRKRERKNVFGKKRVFYIVFKVLFSLLFTLCPIRDTERGRFSPAT